MAEIVFHIGLLKTASTTLQMQYFPARSELNYIHRSTVPDIGRFITVVTNKNPCYFNVADVRGILGGYLDERRLNLVSAENLSGQLLAAIGTPGLDFRYQILKNLSNAYSDARVFIVIRRQDGYAKSMYREYLRQGGTEKVQRFFGGKGSRRPPIMSDDNFLFSPYIDSIHALFPKGVLVLPFEEFASNQSAFLKKLEHFLGLQERPFSLGKTNDTRLGDVGLEVTRILNRWFRSQLNPGGLLPGLPIRRNGRYALVSPVKLIHNSWPLKGRVSESGALHQAAKRIFDDCKDDNRLLDERYALGLKDYGYW